VPLWLAMMATGVEPAGPFTALGWHAHEMIFGYIAAVVAGFVLTAVPNWTGRLPVTGWPLVGAVRSVARRARGFGRHAVAGRSRCHRPGLPRGAGRRGVARDHRRAPCGQRAGRGADHLLALANLLFHLQVQWPALAGYGERMALGGAALLISLIGGRITPSFTRNWMAKAGLAPLPTPFGRFDKITIGATVAAVALWVALPQGLPTGALLALAGALHLVRVARWRGLSARREPIVLDHAPGLLWLAVSLLLMGLAALAIRRHRAATALHALSAGAIGTMTLAVMTRASLGHTGRAIVTIGRRLASTSW
jgi:uncharacterized protein involved in response to NO